MCFKVGEQEGISKSTLYRAKGDLCVRTRREGFGPGSVFLWVLPEAHGPVPETVT
jgi:hypothetical protein